MNSLKYFLIVLCSLQLTGCNEAVVPEVIKHDVDSIAARWVPQHAEGLCDHELIAVPGKEIVIKGETNLPGAKKEILDYLAGSGFNIIDSLNLLPDTNVVKKPWGLITLSVCNIRSQASHDAELVTQAIMGTPVKILKKHGGWLFIQSPDSYLGWTNDDAVTELTEGEMIEWKNADRIIYTKNYGDILSGEGQVVSDLVYGAIMVKGGEEKRSYIVILPDGRKGTVKKSDALEFASWAMQAKPEADNLIAFGRTLLGSPYLWGGTSTKGIDCSGFVKTIYFTGGVILKRDASSQYLYGEEISIENSLDSLAPGDLLFFGRIRNGKKRVGHTGMYIGDTEVIHSSGMVKINSLDSTRVNFSNYLSSTLLGAKRFIGIPAGNGTERVSQHKWYF